MGGQQFNNWNQWGPTIQQLGPIIQQLRPVGANNSTTGTNGGPTIQQLHCIKSELYLAKWKWILRSWPKLKMLVKLHRFNGSFSNPLNWWQIRFGCTALDQWNWNKEKWFVENPPCIFLICTNRALQPFSSVIGRQVGSDWSACGVVPSLICCWWNTFTIDTLRSCPACPPSPNIKDTVLCIQGDSTSRHQITELCFWPLDHSSSDVWRERDRLNITYKVGYC